LTDDNPAGEKSTTYTMELGIGSEELIAALEANSTANETAAGEEETGANGE